MSLRVGLGASQADLDVQGEIDFDFFEESDKSISDKSTLKSSNRSWESRNHVNSISHIEKRNRLENDLNQEHFEVNSPNMPDSCSSLNINKPLITISCDDAMGKKTTIETVIPTPYTYKENKCGKISPNGLKKGKVAVSPRLKSKIFKDEHDSSDESSLSSMSGTESISSISEDSFELNESDSMTDVSPLASPFNCYTPTTPNGQLETAKDPRKDGVKFTETAEQNHCAKCNTIDFHELSNAIKRLHVSQSSNSSCSSKCKSPMMTQNAKCRKNLSFSNDEVRKIDNDNQVLLKKIIAQQNRKPNHGLSPLQVRSSSAVNRQRHQRQIELENLALLRRLESTKPSRNVSRSHLLRDYDRRSSGVLSRASSRSSYPSSTASLRSSGRSSAISIKSPNSTISTHRSNTSSNEM